MKYHINNTLAYMKDIAEIQSLGLFIFILMFESLQKQIKVGISPSKKNCFISFSEDPLQMMNMLLNPSSKLFLFSRYLNFCLDFLVKQKKQLDQKDEVNFKMYDVTNWLTNNYNKHIAQNLMKQRQSENEICSINIVQFIEYNKRNIFPQKLCRK